MRFTFFQDHEKPVFKERRQSNKRFLWVRMLWTEGMCQNDRRADQRSVSPDNYHGCAVSHSRRRRRSETSRACVSVLMGVATAQSTTLAVPEGSDSMLPINLCSVATSNQGNGARRHAVIRTMKSFACRPMPAAAVGPSDADLLTAARRPVSTVSISFLLYYGCGSLCSMLHAATFQNNDPDRRNLFRSLLHVLFLAARSVYFPSLALNEPLIIKH